MRDYSDLPQEVLVEILMRLAIEDLVKSTAVCKSWNSLIKDPTFISTHLGKILSSTNTQLLFFRLCTLRDPWSESGGGIDYSLRFDNKALDEYKQLSCPNIGGCALRVAGSYNGLVCLVEEYYGYNCILWNPVIKKAIRVPQSSVRFCSRSPNFDIVITDFGFDSKTGDYKLVRFVQFQASRSVEVEVYSLNSNCWTSIPTIAPKYGLFSLFSENYGNSFVNGATHLLAYKKNGPDDRRRNLVLAFDVSEQDLTEIPLPDCLSYECGTAQLLKYGQSSIATMTWELREVHLWVMKEYAVATSWTKVLVVAEESVSRVLFFRNDEQVFVPLNGGWMASVDINTKHYEILGVESIGLMESYLVVDSYVESLVLLDKYCNAGWDVIPIKEDYYPNSTTNYVMDLFSWMDAA